MRPARARVGLAKSAPLIALRHWAPPVYDVSRLVRLLLIQAEDWAPLERATEAPSWTPG